VGLPDKRKLTAILYLNPSWDVKWGGELRVWGNGGVVEDVAPLGDRLMLFWSDQVFRASFILLSF
jgi:Rps23 Pro-64 3,4-dihydroxylase Tpa1-like proline 4-hydroxylase